MATTMGDFVIGFYPQCPKCGAQLTVETRAKKRAGGVKVTCGARGGKSSISFYVEPVFEGSENDE